MNINQVDPRIQMLQEDLKAFQKEANEVFTEIQKSLQAITRINSMAFKVMDERLKKLEEKSDIPNVDNVPKNNEGKEL